MKKISIVYLFLLSLCCFLHYPLALIFPFGAESSVDMVFNFEFPHVFIASSLSLGYIVIDLGKINLRDLYTRALGAGLGLILLSGLIYSVPFYRVIESAAFFTVPLGVFLALKRSEKDSVIYYVFSVLFIINLTYCLFLNGKFGIAGNQNWLAATLICSFPFFLLILKKLPINYFRIVACLTGALTVYVLYKTSARALIPAVGAFVLYFLYQRKPLRFNALIYLGLVLVLGTVISMKSDKVMRGVNQDIRGPLAKDTISLILSSPFLGVGPGNFQRDFPPHASDTLKKRIYYSSIAEHPHNELLNMAAGCGLPVAFLWLFFLYSLLKKRPGFEEIAIQFCVIVGFMMGMADKPLTESPSVIVFLVACGFLLPKSVFKEEQKENKNVANAGIFLALGVLAFTIFRAQTDIRSRYHFWQGERLRAVLSSNPKQIVPDMFKHYKLSSEIDPTFINAAYNAATVSLHFYDSLSQDKELLERMIALEPDYSDFNKWIGLYYMKQAALLGEGEEKRAIEAEAEKYYLRNYDLSPWNINRCRELIRFYVRTSNDSEIEKWILKARDVAWERLETRYTHTDKVDLPGDMRTWIEAASKDLNYPSIWVGSMKANEGKDYSGEEQFKNTNALRSYTQRNISSLDEKFFNRRLRLLKAQFSQGLTSTAAILNHLASITVEGGGVEWPVDTFEKAKGSELSVATLACAMNMGIGNESILLVNEDSLLCVLFDGDRSWILNVKDSVLIEASLDEFHKNKDLRKQLCGSEKDNFKYELFCYPEAFCLRNQLVSDLVTSFHDGVFIMCNSPLLDRIRIRKKIGDREVRYARSFIRLLDTAALNFK